MTTVSQIILDAFRESNLIRIGASPTVAEETEALRLFNRYVSSLFSIEMGENLVEVNHGKNNVEAPSVVELSFDDFDDRPLPNNTRLICNLEQPTTINYPVRPCDGARMLS